LEEWANKQVKGGKLAGGIRKAEGATP